MKKLSRYLLIVPFLGLSYMVSEDILRDSTIMVAGAAYCWAVFKIWRLMFTRLDLFAKVRKLNG